MVASYRSVTSVPTAELIRTGSQWVKGFEGRYTYNAQTRVLYYVCVEQKKLMPKATNTGSQFAWTLNKESKSYGTFTHAMLVAMLMGKVPVQATLGLGEPKQDEAKYIGLVTTGSGIQVSKEGSQVDAQNFVREQLISGNGTSGTVAQVIEVLTPVITITGIQSTKV
jgi:hypothetical protein